MGLNEIVFFNFHPTIVRLKKEINIKNVLDLSRKEIRQKVSVLDRAHKEVFLHYIFNKYFDEKKDYSWKFISTLKKLKSKLDISYNIDELNKIRELEEWIFTKDRHQKKLDTNHKLNKGEVAHARFWTSKLFININGIYKEVTKGELLLTNRAIFIYAESGKKTKIYYRNISNIEFSPLGFMFTEKDNNYVLRIHDQDTLNISVRKIIRKRRVKRWK